MSFRNRDVGEMIASDLEADPQATKRAMEIMTMVGRLEGVKLDRRAQVGAATIGGAMKVYDSAFDRYDISRSRGHANEITSIVEGQGTSQGSLDTKLKKALELAHDNLNPAALQALTDLTRAQTDSLRQRDGSAGEENIRDITRRKGANTVLLFALEVSPDISSSRKVCYEELGYLVQLLDDYADKEVDKKEGIATLATISSSPEMVRQIKSQYEKVRNLFKQHYEEHQIIELFNYIDRLMVGSGILLND